jgi:hypothetical protein
MSAAAFLSSCLDFGHVIQYEPEDSGGPHSDLDGKIVPLAVEGDSDREAAAKARLFSVWLEDAPRRVLGERPAGDAHLGRVRAHCAAF